jgi:CRISPR/Cas system-associated exonuclease Cas4 (RecB family)
MRPFYERTPMNKEKLAAIKNKVKDYAPIASNTLGFIVTAYAIFVINNVKKDHVKLTEEDRELLKTGASEMTYVIDGCTYVLRHTGPNHTD